MLSPKQKMFVQEYLRLGEGQAAAIAAGYAPKSAKSRASKLLRMPEVQAYRRELEAELFRQMGITKEWIGTKLVEIVDRCTQGVPHLSWNSETKRKEPDGLWVNDDATAIKALHELYYQLGFAQGDDETKEQQEGFEEWLARQNGGSGL